MRSRVASGRRFAAATVFLFALVLVVFPLGLLGAGLRSLDAGDFDRFRMIAIGAALYVVVVLIVGTVKLAPGLRAWLFVRNLRHRYPDALVQLAGGIAVDAMGTIVNWRLPPAEFKIFVSDQSGVSLSDLGARGGLTNVSSRTLLKSAKVIELQTPIGIAVAVTRARAIDSSPIYFVMIDQRPFSARFLSLEEQRDLVAKSRLPIG